VDPTGFTCSKPVAEHLEAAATKRGAVTEAKELTLILTGLATLCGAVVGSFLNVVIHRVPRGESIIWPGSRCPHCQAAIRVAENIPLLSFFWLRGRCRYCQGKISFRYPLVELLTAVIFASIVWKNAASPESLIEMAFAGTMIALLFIDAATRTLPNVITYSLLSGSLLANIWRWGWGEPLGYSFDFSLIFTVNEEVFSPVRIAIRDGLVLALAAPALWLLDRVDLFLYGKYFDLEIPSVDEECAADEAERRPAAIGGIVTFGLMAGICWALYVLFAGSAAYLAISGAERGLIAAVTGALVGVVPIWLLRALYFQIRGQEGMGLGDVKMMAGIGAFLGWQGALSVLLIGSITGALFGIIIARREGAGLQTTIPLGCFLGIAALITLFRTAL